MFYDSLDVECRRTVATADCESAQLAREEGEREQMIFN